MYIINNHHFDRTKGTNALLYVLSKLNCERRELLAIIYLAERENLVENGLVFIGGSFEARSEGAVHQGLDAILKEGNLGKLDMDELSINFTHCLDRAIEMNPCTRDDAWMIAYKKGRNVQMSLPDIAKAGGATEGMIDYIKTK
jgi:hypothetical protein